jgi:hypothetical protein
MPASFSDKGELAVAQALGLAGGGADLVGVLEALDEVETGGKGGLNVEGLSAAGCTLTAEAATTAAADSTGVVEANFEIPILLAIIAAAVSGGEGAADELAAGASLALAAAAAKAAASAASFSSAASLAALVAAFSFSSLIFSLAAIVFSNSILAFCFSFTASATSTFRASSARAISAANSAFLRASASATNLDCCSL